MRSGTRSLFVVAAVALAACGGDQDASGDALEAGPDTLPPSVPAPELENGVLIISPERIREWQASGEPFVLVDARDSVQFAQEHIPEAINISYVDIRPGARLPERGSRIVVYCSDASCPISRYAIEALSRLGYTNLYDMKAGIQGWKSAGYPTVIGS